MSHATTLDAGELAFDPAVHPELYEGVRTRRIFAFIVDAVVVLFLMVAALSSSAFWASSRSGSPGSSSRRSGRWSRSSTPC
ncbi:MAG: hypothetical protein ACRED5_19335 [Propylenella sp.]